MVVVVVVAPHVPRVGAAHLSPAPSGAAQRRRPVGRGAGDCVAVAAAAAAWNGAGGGGGEKKEGREMSRGLPPTAPSPGFLPATRPVTFYNRGQRPSPAGHRVASRAPPASTPFFLTSLSLVG